MEKLPENLTFYRCFPGVWSDLPSRAEDCNTYTFFSTPLFASEKAVRSYGTATLLNCLAVLRNQAQQLNGIDSFQAVCDRNSKHPNLIFLEEREGGDRGVRVLSEDDRPFRTIAILDYEHYLYCLRYGEELIGLRYIGE